MEVAGDAVGHWPLEAHFHHDYLCLLFLTPLNPIFIANSWRLLMLRMSHVLACAHSTTAFFFLKISTTGLETCEKRESE